jgi:hypothetical protein
MKHTSSRQEFQELLLGVLGDEWQNTRDLAQKVEASGKPTSGKSVQDIMSGLVLQGHAEVELRGKTFFYRRTQ